MSADGGYHDDHDVDNEEFLRGQRTSRREFFPSEVEADDSEKGKNCVEEERDEVKEELRLNHLSRVGEPVGVPNNEECPDEECSKGNSRCKGVVRFWHVFK